MRALLAALMLGAVLASPAQAQSYRLNDQSAITFVATAPLRENGVHGVCHHVVGTVEVPHGDFERATARVSLAINDFEEKSGMDQHTFTAIEAPRFPSVAFISQKFTVRSRQVDAEGTHLTGVVDGVLSFHGVKQPVSAEFTALAGPSQATLDTEFNVSLKAHAIDAPTVLIIQIRDQVKIEVHLVATPL